MSTCLVENMRVAIIVSITLILPFAACVEHRQARGALVSSATRECFDLGYRHNCFNSSYVVDEANIALECGSNYLPYAENFVSQCVVGDDGDLCLHSYTDTNVNYADAAVCRAAVNSSTCSEECRNILQAAADGFGCCFFIVFNERLSPLILGHDVRVSLVACNITVKPACRNLYNLTEPSDAKSCTFDQYWSRTVNYACRVDVAQPYINAVLKNSTCTPLARHQINVCSRGVNNTYCLELYGGSFNPVVPLRIVYRNPILNNAAIQCLNYSTFDTRGCPVHCREALETAIDEFGCCINYFNDTINGVTLPQFGSSVMTVCGIESPGICENRELSLVRGGSVTVRAIAVWIYVSLCFSWLFCT